MLLIFDADGTLFDSHNCIYRIWVIIGEKFGRSNLFDNEKHFEEVYRKHHGDWKSYAVAELGFCEDDFEKIIEIWLENVVSVYAEYSEWFEGVPSILHELEERGHVIAIATNNSERLFIKPLSKIGKSYPIHDHISHEKVQKPEPDMIVDHMKNLGFCQESTAMIGDTLTDLKSARNAGVMSIWAKYGSLQEISQLEGFYDHILESPNYLLELFK